MHLACQILRIIDRHSIVLFPTSKVKNDWWEFNLDVYWLIFNGKHVSWNLETTRCHYKPIHSRLGIYSWKNISNYPWKALSRFGEHQCHPFWFSMDYHKHLISPNIWTNLSSYGFMSYLQKLRQKHVWKRTPLAKSLSFSSCNCPFHIPSSNGRSELGVHIWWRQQILLQQ